jgi:looped-hinge helix DNA binding domain, AbrB family
MRATGIVRRIDELGRVVIPKEIRRTLRIREGEPLEIFTGQEGEIFLKKYSPIEELSKYAKELAEVMAQTTGHLVCICDQNQIVAAVGGGQREYYEQAISKELEQFINDREVKIFGTTKKDIINLIETEKETSESVIIQPIISAGDAIGAVILIGTKNMVDESEVKIAQVAASFLGKQME